jgi:hypothetical protein
MEMWVAVKPFRYRSVFYDAGDRVPAEDWPGRKALVSMRRIREAPEEETAESVPFREFKRAQLNEYAIEQGIEDAEDYPNRESLIEKLDEVLGSSDEEDEEIDFTDTEEEEEEEDV